MKMDMKNLETQIEQKQPELDGKIAKLQAKIERNLEYGNEHMNSLWMKYFQKRNI